LKQNGLITLDVGSVVNKILDKSKDSLQNTLNFLSNVINSPYKTIVTIDENFRGSFIRSASLVPLVIKTYDKVEKEEIVTVSWDRFVNFINKLDKHDKIKFLYTVIKRDEDEEGEITIDKNMIDVNRPLTSLIKIMRKARRKAVPITIN